VSDLNVDFVETPASREAGDLFVCRATLVRRVNDVPTFPRDADAIRLPQLTSNPPGG